jgi:hypothetical protein
MKIYFAIGQHHAGHEVTAPKVNDAAYSIAFTLCDEHLCIDDNVWSINHLHTEITAYCLCVKHWTLTFLTLFIRAFTACDF